MFPTASLTAFLCLAFSVAATPIVVDKRPVSLSFARHLNVSGAHDLVQKDQARAKRLVSISKAKRSGTLSPREVINVGATNAASFYSATVGVGNPPTNCKWCSLCSLTNSLKTRFQTIYLSTREVRIHG